MMTINGFDEKTLTATVSPEDTPAPRRLTLKAVVDGGPVGERRAFSIVLVDGSGREFISRFHVRNHYIGMIQRALSRIIPETAASDHDDAQHD